jgi:hypothetical protein
MKRTPHIIADWKIVLTLWLPLFAAVLWYAIAERFDHLWLAALALAVAASELCSRAVLVVRSWQRWRASMRRE